VVSCGTISIAYGDIIKSNPGLICVPCSSSLIVDSKHSGFVLEMETFTSLSVNGISMCLRAPNGVEVLVEVGQDCFDLLVVAIGLFVNQDKIGGFQNFYCLINQTD
jgi:hypothetical protein